MLNWNADNIKNKKQELYQFLTDYNVDVLFLTETCTTPNDTLKFPNYTTYRCDRIHHKGGGSAIIAKNSLTTGLVRTDNTQGYEDTTIILELNKTKIYLTCIYNTPNNKLTEAHFKKLLPAGTLTLVSGDLNSKNVNWGCRATNKNGETIFPLLNKYGCTLFAPNEPTHYPKNPRHEPDILDITISNFQIPIAVDVVHELSSDHLPVLNTVGIQHDQIENKTKITDWKLFYNLLKKSETPNTEMTNTEQIEDQIKVLTESMLGALKEATTETKQEGSYMLLPKNIKNLIKQRNWIRKQYQRTLDPNLKRELNALNRQIKKLCQENQQEKWNEKVTALCTTDQSIWKMSKSLKNKFEVNKPLLGQSGLVYSVKEKTEVFAETMEKQFTPNTFPKDDKFEIEVRNKINSWKANNPPNNNKTYTTIEEVELIVKTLKKRKAPGGDRVNNKMLKNAPSNIISKLTEIINSCITLNYFPQQWKEATIILFPKPKKDPKNPENHRPISLLSALSKIYERVIYNQIQPHLDKLPDEQFGFRKGLSTTMQLVRINEFIGSGLHKKEAIAFVLLDVARAFDKIWHLGMVAKLIDFGFDVNQIYLLENYLTNRTFKIRSQNQTSTSKRILAGIPQGSILGPILYIIYVSDFPIQKHHNSLTAFYADDTGILYRSLNADFAIKKVQKTLLETEKWCSKWKVAINAQKSNLILIRRTKTQTKVKEKLKLFGQNIDRVKKANYLGVVINDKLTWQDNVKHSIGKTYGILNRLRPILGRQSKLPLNLKKLIYTSSVRPIMTYASPAWNTIKPKTLQKLQVVQNKILREITNAPWFVRNKNIQKDLNIDSIKDHLTKLNSNFFTKHKDNHTVNFKDNFCYEVLREDEHIRPWAAFALSDAQNPLA